MQLLQLLEAFKLKATQKAITTIPSGCASRKDVIGCVWYALGLLPCEKSIMGECTDTFIIRSAFRGQKVEIVEYAQISVPIPQLDEILVRLDKQVAWLVHVRDNVRALLDCQDRYI